MFIWKLCMVQYDKPINNINSWNLAKVKLVKILKNLYVVHIVINTFQTPAPKSIEWPKPFSDSLPLNMLDEFVTTIAIAKAHYLCLSMFANISYITLIITRINWSWSTKTIFRRIRSMTWRCHSLQMSKPFYLSEKWKREKMSLRCYQ